MNNEQKKIAIIISVIVICIIGLVIIRNIERGKEVAKSQQIETTYSEKMKKTIEYLEENGIKLKNPKVCRESDLDKIGYRFELEQGTIELYELDKNEIFAKQILLQNGKIELDAGLNKKREVYVYNSVIITNCLNTQAEEKLVELFDEVNE